MADRRYEYVTTDQIRAACEALGLDVDQVADLSIRRGAVTVRYFNIPPEGYRMVGDAPTSAERTITYPVCEPVTTKEN